MMMPVPALSVTRPTPPRVPQVGADAAQVPLIPPKTARLLYRGTLSLPDSHLLLDGLTFSIALPTDDPHAHAAPTLLATPLALALESMRGRPSLRFAGVVRLADVSCDFAGDVTLHVHPRSVLTRQLFAHHLCATHVPPAHVHTALGVRIRLGDGDGNGNGDGGGAPDDIVVYGRPHPSSSTMQLCVARVVPAPAPAHAPAHTKLGAETRPPRPDDPIPRRPPAGFAGIARVGPGLALKLGVKRGTKSGDADRDAGAGADGGSAKKRLRKGVSVSATDASGSLHDLGKNARPGAAAGAAGAGLFKVPLLPPSKARGKLPATGSDADVFDAPPEDTPTGTDAEVQNKMFIKKAAVRLLGAAGIGRQHADFKEFFNQVYRGTAFALRAKLKTPGLESDKAVVELVDRVAQAHVTLYLGGQGVGVYLLQ